MKPPMSSDFYKLYGVIKDDLPKGDYLVTLTSGTRS